MILLSILLASLFIVLTIIIHGLFTRFILFLVNRHNITDHEKHLKEYWIALMILILFVASIFEASIWALMYMVIGEMQSFEQALYFSIVTFTTLGYGDVVLSDSIRLVSSFEAAIGIIIFGWSTAMVFSLVQKLFFNKK